MPFTRAGQLARHVPTARASDPLALVAENLRNSPHGVLPVLDRVTYGEGDAEEREARVIGLIDMRLLSRATELVAQGVAAQDHLVFSALMRGSSNGAGHASANGTPSHLEEAAPTALWQVTANDVMTTDVAIVPSIFSLENALITLERFEATALPVIDEAGYYRGMLSRADVVSALARGVRPPLVGGMATPLGVWLTDGRLSGGAPVLGLFLTGVLLAAFFTISDVLLQLIFTFLKVNWGLEWTAGAGDWDTFRASYGVFPLVANIIHGLLFLGMFRMTPIAGIHAAEHQTVWAMERGLPLEPEIVAEMPRAHPRCGTNLTAIAGIVLIFWQHTPIQSKESLLFLLILIFFLWRSLGTWMQNELTTRPATTAQLESGIRAANELMAKYQDEPFAPPPMPLRLLNSGMLWSAMGMISTLAALEFLRDYVAAVIRGGG